MGHYDMRRNSSSSRLNSITSIDGGRTCSYGNTVSPPGGRSTPATPSLVLPPTTYYSKPDDLSPTYNRSASLLSDTLQQFSSSSSINSDSHTQQDSHAQQDSNQDAHTPQDASTQYTLSVSTPSPQVSYHHGNISTNAATFTPLILPHQQI